MKAIKSVSDSAASHACGPDLMVVVLIMLGWIACDRSMDAAEPAAEIRLILSKHCFDCHAEGAEEGSFRFESLFAMEDDDQSNETWYRVLKQLQAKRMPPSDGEPLGPDKRGQVIDWIKYGAFAIDPDHPDPGHVTVRRLNQIEYRNTIRDLLGAHYDTDANFPADDTGHGFDNIGEVLSLSPLLLEKYVNAAEEIITSVVPRVAGVIPSRRLAGGQFTVQPHSTESVDPNAATASGSLVLSYYENATAGANFNVPIAGEYRLCLNVQANETYVDNQFDLNRCRFAFFLDRKELLSQAFVRQGGKAFAFEFDVNLTAGPHSMAVAVEPLSSEPRIRDLRIEVESVDLVGPKDERYYEKPENYDRFFPRAVPETVEGRRVYATELLGQFAAKAFRRPVDEDTIGRLVELAESVSADGKATFESGIAKSMTAVLASPRFIFREEAILKGDADPYPLIDEHALASRLSYFLWSSMPDEELLVLADQGKLRSELDKQVDRMIRDGRSFAFSENFVGQWLRVRAIETVEINASAVQAREPRAIDPDGDVRRKRFFELFRKSKNRSDQENQEFEEQRLVFRRSFEQGPQSELTGELRTAMRRESELHFDHIVKNNLSLLQMIDCDYAFLNDDLWAHYQIEGLSRVDGGRMRRVELPKSSLRGGLLTQGSFLAVTSNPDRTSPVKRGLFILENLLGSPPPAPPPNIPALEDVESDSDRKRTLRETLALHRENLLCASCHDRMDPLGLALENFNALGQYRTSEFDQRIESGGSLGDDERFETVRELKAILVNRHASEIYHCMTEKLMTYALGRAVQYRDSHTLGELVDQLIADDGRALSLIEGIIHSDAFQRTRNPDHRVAKPSPFAKVQ